MSPVSPTGYSKNQLGRYIDIIPDWEGFLAFCHRPLPTTIRTNTLRITAEDLVERLTRTGLELEAIAWAPGVFTVASDNVGKRLEHWLGLFYVQEAVQVLPAFVLAPRPGERVLDLCAAPGGKCTQIAALMQNKGLVVANEPNGRRQQALLANLNRLGVLNAAVTEYRGESFPLGASFDRVLIDAPCSAEGTLRKEPAMQKGASPAAIKRMAAIQRRLIRRGYELLRPGGTLVYSTCTFAPEENEAVAAVLLADTDARLEPVVLPFPASPGIKAWQGLTFPEEITGCVRIYPHQIDSGGAFIARFRKPK